MATEVLEAIAKAECHLIVDCPACAAVRRLGPVAVKLAVALDDVRAQFLSDDTICSVGWPKRMDAHRHNERAARAPATEPAP